MNHLDKIKVLQWVRGLITAVMVPMAGADLSAWQASMGPRSDNRGYAVHFAARQAAGEASMGPRSDNRGYARRSQQHWPGRQALQWVRGLITAVMPPTDEEPPPPTPLQWVRGLITAVMAALTATLAGTAGSFNGSAV